MVMQRGFSPLLLVFDRHGSRKMIISPMVLKREQERW